MIQLWGKNHDLLDLRVAAFQSLKKGKRKKKAQNGIAQLLFLLA